MTPEILPPEDPLGYDDRVDRVSTVMEKWAANASMQTIARLAMIALTALSIPFWGISSWAGIRIITAVDKIAEQQAMYRDEFIALRAEYRGKMQLLDLDNLHLDSKMVEIDGRINKRIDIISEQNRRNADAIDALKEKVYPMLPMPKR